MEIKINQVVGAGGLAVAGKILWKFLRRNRSPETMSLVEAVDLMKRTMKRIEELVEGIPEMREAIARHERAIEHNRNATDTMRFDIQQLKEENEQRDQKLRLLDDLRFDVRQLKEKDSDRDSELARIKRRLDQRD